MLLYLQQIFTNIPWNRGIGQYIPQQGSSASTLFYRQLPHLTHKFIYQEPAYSIMLVLTGKTKALLKAKV